MNPPQKQPVRPWLPERKPAAAAGKTRIVVQRAKADWRAPLRAGWIVTWLLVFGGGISGAITFGVLPGVGVLVVVALAVVVMVRGAAWRGVFLIVAGVAAPFVSGVLMYGVLAALDSWEREKKHSPAPASEAPLDASTADPLEKPNVDKLAPGWKPRPPKAL